MLIFNKLKVVFKNASILNVTFLFYLELLYTIFLGVSSVCWFLSLFLSLQAAQEGAWVASEDLDGKIWLNSHSWNACLSQSLEWAEA